MKNDAYHLIQHDDKVELWFGEAKFRKDYKKPIDEVLSGFSKTTSEGYFSDNVLAIVKEKHNISNGRDIIDKLTPITQTWKKSVLINIGEELEKKGRCKHEYRYRRPSFLLQGGAAGIQGVYGHSEARGQIFKRTS